MSQMLSEQSDIVILLFISLGSLTSQVRFFSFCERVLVQLYKGAIIMTEYVLFIEQRQCCCEPVFNELFPLS